MATYNENLCSAVFDTHDAADRAIRDLKAAGASNDDISVVAREDGEDGETTTRDGSGKEAAKDVVGKGALGGGIGALLGVAALAIPGIGPFVGAGAIASAAVGGAALTGTAIGAAVGAIAGALEDHGVSKADAEYYETRLNDGGIFVSVDTANSRMSVEQANDALSRSGGHSSTIRPTA